MKERFFKCVMCIIAIPVLGITCVALAAMTLAMPIVALIKPSYITMKWTEKTTVESNS